uniref:Uncharacterized protein LOC100181620 n=1 Tax=Phallusia mammillata TaxID=59560 RepID=A0A6F9DHP5_9ASCI|nr:uncharacterized protein LOC100181620 [Phallusia mammillata]
MGEIVELLQMTTCACAVGMATAEGIRAVFRKFVKSRPGVANSIQDYLSDFVNTALSAFILVVCTFEKALTLWGDFRMTFFIFTFFLCIFFFFVFSSYAPSPCQPLEDHWHKISQSSANLVNQGSIKKSSPSLLTRFRLPVSTYVQHGFSTILGLGVGLVAGTQWLKFFWDGFMTSHHMTQLPVLDQCLDCLNTSLFMGILIEASVTFFYLFFFAFVETRIPSQEVGKESLRRKLFKNSLKSIAVVLGTYLFMDITGSFANPFLAYVLQRNCLNDVTSAFNFTIVYVIGPFLGTAAYMFWRGSKKEAKYSV